jgi:hypothetical protein
MHGLVIDKGFLEEYAKRLVEDDARKTAYAQSKEFKGLLDIIRRHSRIDQEDLIYGNASIDGLTAKGFQKVCDAVFRTAPVVEDRRASFPRYHADVEGVRFHLMIGQGSVYWTTAEKTH